MDDEIAVTEDEGGWSELPDLLIESIYSYLNMRDRYNCSMVCKRWYDAFYLPQSWSVFVFDERTLTRRRFNYYSGWQYTLDHLRAQMCLSTVGSFFRVLIFAPMTNFYNMYEFMNMLSFYAEHHNAKEKCTVSGIGEHIHTLRYQFPCDLLARFEEDQISRLYGTGGKLLEAVKRLMGNLKKLRHLELTDLLLDGTEAKTLLDDVATEQCLILRTLSIVNMTKSTCPIIHPGVFINLQVLEMSPQNLSEELVSLLADSGLPTLHLRQTEHSPPSPPPISPKAWSQATARNPRLRVHLSLTSLRVEREIVWQERAPVASILYDCPFSKLEAELLNRTLEWYRETLQLFGHVGLPRFTTPKSFIDRTDPFLLMMVKECPRLNTLILRERVSTCTLLLIAEAGRNRLKDFYVRRNAVIMRFDWPISPEWSEEYQQWLKKCSQSYEATESAISDILGKSWTMLSDKEFVKLWPKMY
ncbi:F-box only protein 39 isoform X2 [Halyomorpha halys]|uniref:F-box only protein 39 isoform X2 n=1 Tax=Halyomorpha halys TaxID=286706 RepID=UPI0006D52090|nr:uncharacterized protein LOC106677051 isoform X2 [Halyomorpha halys]